MISVIVPVYNAEAYLGECVESLMRQTLNDIEILLINDGSIDNSAVICEKYSALDNRIRFFNQPNAGVSVARNKGLQEAKGEYVCFVDADDVVASNFLQTLFDMSGCGDFAICGYTRNQSILGQKGSTVKYYDTKSFIIQIFDESLVHPNIWMMMFKNAIIRKKEISFTPGCVRNEDTEFYIKYMIHENRIAVSDYKGYFYRDNPNSAVHKFNEKSLTFIEADQRISDELVKAGVMNNNNLIVPASVQYFIYQTARQKNIEIYDKVHELYDVQLMMRRMIRHTRYSRKGVALAYLFLGRKYFFKLLSFI